MTRLVDSPRGEHSTPKRRRRWTPTIDPGTTLGLALTAAAIGACQPSADAPPPTAPVVTPPPAVAEPLGFQPNTQLACQATISEETGGLAIHVNGAVTEHPVAQGAELTTFAYNSESIAVAIRQAWRTWEPGPDQSTLYQLSCTAPYEMRTLVTRAGADFGHAAATSDGRTVYFSDGGVSAIELDTLKVQEIVARPAAVTKPACGSTPVAPRFVVDRLHNQDQDLGVTRFEPCAHANEWEGHPGLLTAIASGGNARFVPQSPVHSVAVDPSGTLWLGDGGACHAPGVRAPQSPGVVWRSADGGAHWTPVHFDTNAANGTAPATAVTRVAAGRNPGEIAVLSSVCSTPHVGLFGGTLHITTDGGTSWQQLTLPDEFAVISFGDGISDFALVDGSLAHIRTWSIRPTNRDRVAWDTRDGGRTWVVTGDAPFGPPPPLADASLNGVEFRATADGLIAQGPSGTQTHIFRTLDVRPDHAHCLVFRPKTASAQAATRLTDKLTRAGFPSSPREDTVTARMTNAAVQRLLGSPVTYRRVTARDGSPTAWTVQLTPDIPRAWRRQIASVAIDESQCQ
ncbi:MAG: hypothetical protein B7733_11140 [Myxococcales bacterium FL481]|nr:MAG: hypothetical protein B7733_11140 [Myxococcales bacterium FL481]